MIQAGEVPNKYSRICEKSDEERQSNANVETIAGKPRLRPTDPLEYGDGRAKIVNYAVCDESGQAVTNIFKGEQFSIWMQVESHADIPNPIFAFTIKDKKGNEIAGTNTAIAGFQGTKLLTGQTKSLSFTQRCLLAPGEYLINLGLTGYEEGGLAVYHRIYDACSFTLVSEKNSIGFFDMESKIAIASDCPKTHRRYENHMRTG